MVDFNQAIQLIRDNGGFKPNANDSSYYRVYTTQGNKPIQVRVSNHGTHLWTWYGKEYDPSISINICVVFSQNGECNSNTNVDMRILDNQGTVVGEKKQFEVVQYTYNCSLLDKQDIGYINQAILNIWKNNGFSDPFNGTDKAATKQVLHPVANNKQETNENKIMNKKQVIRLNENQLKQIVMESVKEVLNNEHFPSSGEHPDIYTSDTKQGNKYQIRYGSDYGYKKDSSLLKNGLRNPNAKRTEWMWIKDMVNHANDLFTEYHLYDEEAYEAIEKLYTLLKQGVSESDAIDKVGDMFYRDEN